MRTIVVAILAVMFIACTKTVYVPQTETHIEYRDRVQYDSILHRDSIYVYKNGDTVMIYKDRWRERVHIQKDTVYRLDSIPYPVEVFKDVKYIPKVYKWSFWICLGLLGYVIFRIYRKTRG